MKHYLPLLLLLFGLTTQAQRVGENAPNFRLVNAQGELVQLGDFAGTPLILNTWATWCAFCIEELPLFENILKEINQGSETSQLNVFLVNNNERFEIASQYLADIEVDLPSAFNPSQDQRSHYQDQGIRLDDTMDFIRSYRIRGMPTTFFIDAEGIIQGIKIGLLLPSEVPDLLASIGISWQEGNDF